MVVTPQLRSVRRPPRPKAQRGSTVWVTCAIASSTRRPNTAPRLEQRAPPLRWTAGSPTAAPRPPWRRTGWSTGSPPGSRPTSLSATMRRLKARTGYRPKPGAGGRLWPTPCRENPCGPSRSTGPPSTAVPTPTRSRVGASPTKRRSTPSRRSGLLWRPTTWSATAPWGRRYLPPACSRRRPEPRSFGRNLQPACRRSATPCTRGGKIWGRKNVRSEFPDLHLSSSRFHVLLLARRRGGGGGEGSLTCPEKCVLSRLESFVDHELCF